MLRPAALAGAVILALTSGLVANGTGSLSDLDIEFTEAKVTLQTVSAENEVLKRELNEAGQTIKSLTNSLAVANGEADIYRKEAADLKLRMEALGVDGLGADKNKLEQRLLKAVRVFQLVQTEKDKLSGELVALSEAVLRFTKNATTDDAEARMALEAEMRNVSVALGIPTAGENATTAKSAGVQSDLTSGMIISIKEDLSLIVGNIGANQGVKVGMPFKVIRSDAIIASVRVVEVREKIFGAVIQNLISEKNKIQVGDRLKVDVE